MIQLGYAEVDITPQNGEDLCGFALRKGPAQPAHDSLNCRWLSLKDDISGQRILLGAADILSLSRGTFSAIRKQVRNNNGGDVAVALATTHTHSGPATVTLRHCGRMSRSYMSGLKAKVANAGGAAARGPYNNVHMVVGSSQSTWAYNRRNESGPVDHEVVAIGFKDAETGKLLATIVNYSCHPVVLGHKSNAVSADYPGYLTEYVARETAAPCVFLNGACGDLNPINNHSEDVSEARKAGAAIGAKAVEALQLAKPLAQDKMKWFTRRVEIPVYQPKSEAELEMRLDMLQEKFGLDRSLFKDRVANDVRLLVGGRYPKTVTLELSLLTFGKQLALLFVPGELFSSLGLRIKAMMLDGKLIISGFSNGSVGYLPDRQAYDAGGYEPYFANFFYDFPEFDPGVEDVILNGVQNLLNMAKLTAIEERGVV